MPQIIDERPQPAATRLPLWLALASVLGNTAGLLLVMVLVCLGLGAIVAVLSGAAILLAGLSHHLRIDPVWLRLAFALLIPVTSGFAVVAYIILWIAVPGNATLEEQESVRKMYRNPEGKVLGGVASGIASYTGWDISIIRIVWVLFAILGGSGIILYIILWIALPEAKSLTEKMRMQGQPVTLSNIEKTVKERLNEKPGEESTLARIILFPFRALSVILTALGKALGPIVTALVKGIRIFTGLLITIVGITVSAAFLIVIAILSGLLTPE